jgi:hypothetical protein
MSIDWNSAPQGIVVCLWQYWHKGMKDILPQRFVSRWGALEIDTSTPTYNRFPSVTNLHDLEIDDKTIQAILRHSNIAVT